MFLILCTLYYLVRIQNDVVVTTNDYEITCVESSGGNMRMHLILGDVVLRPSINFQPQNCEELANGNEEVTLRFDPDSLEVTGLQIGNSILESTSKALWGMFLLIFFLFLGAKYHRYRKSRPDYKWND